MADLKRLKELASGFSNFVNNEFKENLAYTPNEQLLPGISVTNWLKMPKVFQEAIGHSGFPIGNISCIYGKTDTGKTSILMEAIVQAQKQNIVPILILTEHKFDFSRIDKFMGGDSEAMAVIQPQSLEQGYTAIEKILKNLSNNQLVVTGKSGEDYTIDLDPSEKVFIFWDSIGNTLSDTDLEYEVSDWNRNMGKTAKAIKTLTKRVNSLLGRSGVRSRAGILFLNQSYQSMPAYGPSVETPYGGDGVPYSSALVIRLRRKGDLKMTSKGQDLVVGLQTIVEVKKNHISHTKPTSIVYTVASGIIEPSKEALDDYKKKYLKGK